VTEKASEFRQRAEECRLLAKRALPQHRDTLPGREDFRSWRSRTTDLLILSDRKFPKHELSPTLRGGRSYFDRQVWQISSESFRLARLGVGMNWEIQLARPLRTHRCGLPEVVRTLGDAIDLIDEGLPEALRFRPAWIEVKEMLVAAAETRTSRAVENATTLLEHVLEDEGWLGH
jgi:hypothetical protein